MLNLVVKEGAPKCHVFSFVHFKSKAKSEASALRQRRLLAAEQNLLSSLLSVAKCRLCQTGKLRDRAIVKLSFLFQQGLTKAAML